MFIVEPMFAKMVLKLLGGSPSVWNTCLVFYQAALLAGYIYAHLSLKWLGARRQAILHLVLLCLAWICLPIVVAKGWTPPSEGNPALWLLLLMTVSLGLPFGCISASAPVLQTWFAHLGGRSAKDPYFLYAASNLGSLAGLAAYPLLIEPRLAVDSRVLWWNSQTLWWSVGYGVLMVLFAICAVAVWNTADVVAVEETPAAGRLKKSNKPDGPDASFPDGFREPVTWLRRLWWLSLGLVPSALLMGVTAHLSVDIASVPLLWAIPLGLYLLSFIMVFARWPILKYLWFLRILQAAALVGAAGTAYLGGLGTEGIVSVGALHLTAFFLTALVCHGAMAADRPPSDHLTEYYLWMSAGGVVGGLLCALVAPLIFNSVLEYPLMLIAACLLGPPRKPVSFESVWRWWDLALGVILACLVIFVVGKTCSYSQGEFHVKAENLFAKNSWIVAAGVLAFLLQRARPWFTLAVAAVVGVCIIGDYRSDVIHSARSFFGVLRVEKDTYLDSDGETQVCHTLMHGSTMHGQQSRQRDDARDPWTYYHRTGPVGDIFEVLNERKEFAEHGHIGVVGLGTGSIAAYPEKGQRLTYFEIDSKVRRISEDPQFFTYLSSCRKRIGDDLEIRMGDARRTLEKEPDHSFDVLLIDAFSSDAIPVHLITHEAIEMYFKKLAPDGLLMVHLSNRHLSLGPVVSAAAVALNKEARVRDDDDESYVGKSSSTWAVLANKLPDLGKLQDEKDAEVPSQLKWQELGNPNGTKEWTDDYSSIVSVMHWDWLPEWMRRGLGMVRPEAPPADAAN
jgi:hypothetical protein